jgi:hypothetical protein
MKRAVARGLERRELADVHRVGVDENASRKGRDYVTVVCSIEDGAVLYVGDDRTTAALACFYEGLSPEAVR